MFDVTVILELIIVIITAIICRYLVPWLKEKHLEWLVTIATQAAEQTITGSEEKKQYVIEWLQARGITYDSNKIDAIIESCVYKINNETNPPGFITLETATAGEDYTSDPYVVVPLNNEETENN